jgi:hypothetical protein
MRIEDGTVGRNARAFVHQNEVARHQLGCRHEFPLTVAQHIGAGCGQLA